MPESKYLYSGEQMAVNDSSECVSCGFMLVRTFKYFKSRQGLLTLRILNSKALSNFSLILILRQWAYTLCKFYCLAKWALLFLCNKYNQLKNTVEVREKNTLLFDMS